MSAYMRAYIAYWTLIAFVMIAGFSLAEYCDAQTPGAGPNVTNLGQYGPPFTTQGGHFILGGGPAPSLNSACGTGAIVPIGSDSAFQFTTGASATSSCLVTFAAPWNNPPTCQMNDATGGSVPTYAQTKTGIVLSGATSIHAYNVQCFGQPGG